MEGICFITFSFDNCASYIIIVVETQFINCTNLLKHKNYTIRPGQSCDSLEFLYPPTSPTGDHSAPTLTSTSILGSAHGPASAPATHTQLLLQGRVAHKD